MTLLILLVTTNTLYMEGFGSLRYRHTYFNKTIVEEELYIVTFPIIDCELVSLFEVLLC